MRTLIRSVVIAGGLALAVGVAPAAAQVYEPITFKTTFPFMVGRKVLPAGSYTVRPAFDGSASLLEVQGDGVAAFFVGENASAPRNDPKRTEVVFDRAGDRYVLSEIWDESTQEGAEAIPQHGSPSEPADGHHAKK